MNATEFSYNGLTFDYVSVTHSGKAVYDSLDRTLQGYLFNFHVAAYEVQADPATLALRLKAIASNLAIPRKTMLWKSGGSILWEVGSAGVQTVDRRFGPKPRNLQIHQVTGGVSARIEFDIECFILPCSATGDIEEFWWSFSTALDRNFTSSRTITGRMKVRSGIDAPLTFLMDSSLWPRLPNGFYQDSLTHNLSSDGTTIDFTVVQKQVWRTLPQPLTNGHATFRIEQQGMTLTKTLQCSFEAPADTNKQIILQFIVALIRARFPRAITPAPGTYNEFITHLSITNYEFENKMDCTVSSKTGAADFRSGAGLTTPGVLFGDVEDITPGVDDDWSASNGASTLRPMTGTAGIVPQSANPFDVCLAPAVSPGSESNADGPNASRASSNFTGEGALTTADAAGNVTDEQKEYPYTSYVEYWQYILDRHISVLKTTKDGVNDVIQRTAQPTFQILQVGHARRIGKPPLIPAPAYIDAGFRGTHYADHQEVRPEPPKLLGDGRTVEYTIGWSYLFKNPAIRAFNDSNDTNSMNIAGGTELAYPANPAIPVTTAPYTDQRADLSYTKIGSDGKVDFVATE